MGYVTRAPLSPSPLGNMTYESMAYVVFGESDTHAAPAFAPPCLQPPPRKRYVPFTA